MSSEFYTVGGLVVVRLYDEVDGYDLMSVHNTPEFDDAIRRYPHVAYDYSDASEIKFSSEDIVQFAKLAAIETQLNPALRFFVIGNAIQKSPRALGYQQQANYAGANVTLCQSLQEVLGYTVARDDQ